MAAGTLRAKHRERSVVEVGQGLKGLLENRLVILLIRLVVANDQLQFSSEDDGEPLGNSPVFDNSGFTLGAGEGVGLGEREHACEGEAGGWLTWRVNALWGPGMGSFSVGAGTDKHTVSFSAVRAAGDCKSRKVLEPLPAL